MPSQRSQETERSWRDTLTAPQRGHIARATSKAKPTEHHAIRPSVPPLVLAALSPRLVCVGLGNVSFEHSTSDIRDVGRGVRLQLPVALPDIELDSTEVLLVQLYMSLELFPSESLEVGSRVCRLLASCSEALSVEGEGVAL